MHEVTGWLTRHPDRLTDDEARRLKAILARCPALARTAHHVPYEPITERWVQTCRHELLDRTLIWNQAPLLHALREFESIYNQHRPHRTPHSAAPLRPLPEPITDPDRFDRLDVCRHDRLGGLFHEYAHTA
ncbi:hypothetical protein ABZY09_26610 [Streptomyces sp. NPDC002928]|uniref:hypothetical protein n=1 Tax=Streptomyces sp. NPDC002928 TaxID=3154440 RepID=UPI0033A776F6